MRWTYEFKVGLFSVGALLVLIYMFFVLSPDMFHGTSNHDFYTVIDDASGIVNKTQVKTNGVVVGKVKSVQLQGNKSRIDFTVDSSVKIPKGSEVMIKEKGLLGDVFLEVIRAEDKGEYIKNGEMIPPSNDQMSISKLVAVASSIGKDIKKMTSSLSDVLGGEEGHKNVSSIITDIRDVAASLKGILGENRESFKHMIANLEHTTSSLDDVISGQKMDLHAIVTNIKTITEGLKEVLKQDNREKFDRILASLDSAVGDVKGIAGKINKGEGTLGRLVNDDKMINEFEDAVKDLRSMIAPVKKMEVAVDFHAEYRGNSRTQGYLSVYLKPRADKYYLIGITDLVESEKEEFFEKLPPNPGEASPDAITAERFHRTTVERNSLRFNIQYAQRWDFAQLRFGLFQTTGGLAGDFFLWDDKVSFSFEGFDFRKTNRRTFGHMKAYTNIMFFNHVYAMLGVDDITRRDPRTGKAIRPYFFAGGGFVFNDEDLKSLFGLAAARF